MSVSEKIRRKTLTQDVFGGVKTLIKISVRVCEIFNFVDLCSGWALCGRPQPEHESVMPHFLVFSVICFEF